MLKDLLKNSLKSHKKIRNWLVLDNIRSAYNVGAIFRTADGTGITGLILLGITPDPKTQEKVHKTSLGAQNSVPYLYYKETADFLEDLKANNLNDNLFALELTDLAVDLYKWKLPDTIDTKPIFTIVGHELLGVSAKLLVASNQHLYIPMNGYKESLNVAESASILMYEIYRKINY